MRCPRVRSRRAIRAARKAIGHCAPGLLLNKLRGISPPRRTRDLAEGHRVGRQAAARCQGQLLCPLEGATQRAL
eukprot:2959793-Alexandrium_andersonii.AAC.1